MDKTTTYILEFVVTIFSAIMGEAFELIDISARDHRARVHSGAKHTEKDMVCIFCRQELYCICMKRPEEINLTQS